ncbi:MAG: two-component response regulator [Dehalococcoidia bacterium]|nr:two-component response regulator [Dehalococcoidia bacterium]
MEDNPADVRLTREALRESRVPANLRVVVDGVEAMEFLYRRGRYGEAARPDLTLLDLNLPRKDGREVLAEIKSDLTLRCIPVVVLTTSEAGEDVFQCYNLHANCYITKPIDLDRFMATMKSTFDFWFTVVKLPTE